MAAKLSMDFGVETLGERSAIVGIDPGSVTGISTVTEGRLVLVGAVGPKDTETLDRVRIALQDYDKIVIVWEKPQVYARSTRKPSNPQSLMVTAFRAGLVVGQIRNLPGRVTVSDVLPREWKGQVPKDIHNKRVWDALTSREQMLIHSAKFTNGQMDDVLDAVGIAKWLSQKHV